MGAVILSAAKDLSSGRAQILRCAQDGSLLAPFLNNPALYKQNGCYLAGAQPDAQRLIAIKGQLLPTLF